VFALLEQTKWLRVTLTIVFVGLGAVAAFVSGPGSYVRLGLIGTLDVLLPFAAFGMILGVVISVSQGWEK